VMMLAPGKRKPGAVAKVAAEMVAG